MTVSLLAEETGVPRRKPPTCHFYTVSILTAF